MIKKVKKKTEIVELEVEGLLFISTLLHTFIERNNDEVEIQKALDVLTDIAFQSDWVMADRMEQLKRMASVRLITE